MFDVPEAKRIRRDELLPSRTPTPEPIDPEAATYAAATFQQLFGPIETVDVSAPADLQTASNAGADATQEAEEEEQEYEFRLFNLPQSSAKEERREESTAISEHEGVQKLKIRLRSPSPGAEGDGGFVVPFRGWDHYLSAPHIILENTALESAIAARLDELRDSHVRKASEYARAAVSPQDVSAFSKQQKAGCQLSWRVIHLKQSTTKPKKKQAASTSKPVALESSTDSVQHLENPLNIMSKPKSRKKPGKKRRIVLRQRAHAKQQAEEADRDKRTARNREKKLKRRQREREKKAAARAEEGGSVAGDSADPADDVSMTEA